MGTVVQLKDGTVLNLNGDRDFHELLREKLGDSIAEWYEDRISTYDTFRREWQHVLPSREDYNKVAGSYAKRCELFAGCVEKMSEDDMMGLLDDLMELPGWDEY